MGVTFHSSHSRDVDVIGFGCAASIWERFGSICWKPTKACFSAEPDGRNPARWPFLCPKASAKKTSPPPASSTTPKPNRTFKKQPGPMAVERDAKRPQCRPRSSGCLLNRSQQDPGQRLRPEQHWQHLPKHHLSRPVRQPELRQILQQLGATPTTPSNPCKTSISEAIPTRLQNRIMKP